MDCGNGLLLLILQELDAIDSGDILEIISSETSVREDLPAWCRLTHNILVKSEADQSSSLFWVEKKGEDRPHLMSATVASNQDEIESPSNRQSDDTSVKTPETIPLQPLSVMGVGSWPRPDWLLGGLDLLFRNSIDEQHFSRWAADAVELAVAAQVRAGVDFITDGEQRRDAYCSFIGRFIKHCQLVPLRDLAAMAEHPEDLVKSLDGVDLPMDHIRQPVLTGKLKSMFHQTIETRIDCRYFLNLSRLALTNTKIWCSYPMR